MTSEAAATSLSDVEAIRDILRQVIDPEVGINIVDLGLVYHIDVTPECLRVDMTMTSPACPMGEMIVNEVIVTLEEVLPATCQPDVRLVWMPPWDSSMMSEDSRLHFGW